MSAAFDSVDHGILMQRLEKSFGFGGQVLSWLESFIRDRTQSVTIGGSHSAWRRIRFGVPQGSVLGPLLYVLFTAGVPGLVQSLGAGVQQYADDTQAYLHRTAEQAVAAMVELTRILESVEDWMRSNRMKLNPAKTQYIWIGGTYQLNKIDHAELAARFPDIQFLKTVMDLGVTIDQELNMTAHVGCISRSGFYQLRQLRQVRHSLSEKAAHALVHAFVVTRIDYCNAVLHGITKREMDRVQWILNAAARLLLAIPRQSHISAAIRDNLHWLHRLSVLGLKFCQSFGTVCTEMLRFICVSSVCCRRQCQAVEICALQIIFNSSCRTSSRLECKGVDLLLLVRWPGTV